MPDKGKARYVRTLPDGRFISSVQAGNKSGSLRSHIPNPVIQDMKLEPKDVLIWKKGKSGEWVLKRGKLEIVED